ncbi:hypothetical protein IT575_06580 [bacterium]|nr:hypothetical protein [bacterium]
MWSMVLKEYRQRARGVATVGLIIAYTLILGGVSFFVYLAMYAALNAQSAQASAAGRALCVATFIAQMIMALMLSLSLNASTIAAEKDQETFDLLNLTLFKSWEIVLGKFFSSTGFLFILVFTAVPIYTLAFTFGGIDVGAMYRLAAVVTGTTLLISSIGLFFSLVSDDLRTALGRSFLVMIVIGAVTLFLGLALGGSLNSSQPNPLTYYGGLLSFFINPLWAAIDVLGTPLSGQLAWGSNGGAVPYVINSGMLWAFTAGFQTLCAAGLLAVTSMIYPRYRASRQGGVA